MKSITKPLFLILLLLASASATESKGEKLLQEKCASCHSLGVPTPQELQIFKAPAMEAVLFHVKDAHNNDMKKVKAFILNYTQNPKLKESVCESNKVTKFGVMPSLKGKVSPEDLSTIADYIIDKYPTQEFVTFIKQIKTDGKLSALKNSPFLMNQSALPHLTKILIENWEKGTLNLSNEQKEKLLVVRKETMRGVKEVKIKLKKLEAEIIEMSIDGEELSRVKPKVDEVAKLKAKATMIQLKCLKDSIETLNDEQLELLLPFWDM